MSVTDPFLAKLAKSWSAGTDRFASDHSEVLHSDLAHVEADTTLLPFALRFANSPRRPERPLPPGTIITEVYRETTDDR